MCFLCLHIGFSHPGSQFRAVITSIINISQSYGGGGGTNVALGNRHIVGQCTNNDLFNNVIISHLEVEGNKRNIRHVVKMFRLLTISLTIYAGVKSYDGREDI